ncbi:type II secretion system F family protein [uncultured Methanomethylovorans sp.]|uniref:type II secretion system F family protein n=1 Tax=uncultured Methanomethylovorans sp. TaxID=183759 RepID=UPI002AA901A2|nr:type II secretion system F family protein [uncultured Methanomethylovorans sp.]
MDFKINTTFIRQYFKKNPGKYAELRKSLRAARMDVHYATYIEQGVIYAVQTFVIMFVLFYMMPTILKIELFSVFLHFQRILLSYEALVTVPVVSAIFIYYLHLSTPIFKASSRKTRIDMVLPHAAAFCFGMSKGGATMYETIMELARNPHIYGEVATECLYIVRDVELLGADLVKAIHNVADVTPSPTFKDFLENMIPMVEGGSHVDKYFEVKMDQYFDHARKAQVMFIKTLEMISEVYVVAFVAVPIFLLITLVTIGLLNVGQTGYMFQALYIGLPVGSLALLVLLDAISPKEELGMKYVDKVILTRSISIEEEEIDDSEYKKKMNKLEQNRSKKRINDVLKNPLIPISKKPIYAAVFSVPLMVLPFLYLDDTFSKQIVLSLILGIFPVTVAFEYKKRRLKKLDGAIPDFLRRLAEINELGLPLKNAIGLLLQSNIGLLSAEIRRVWLDMEWGGEMRDALARFENRIGTPALRRAVTLLIKASEVSDDTTDVLVIAAEDAENMNTLRSERSETGFMYLATVYLAFGTFLYVCYSFSNQFLVSVAGMGNTGMINPDEIKATMFDTCGILGLFSGLILGEMAEGNVMAGLKHSFILLVVTFVMFESVIK